MDSIASGLSKKSLNIPKIKIHQSVPSDCIREGFIPIVRSAALNDNITILRRFGEGSLPLFERDGIIVNQPSEEDSNENITCRDGKDDFNAKNHKTSSTASSSPERYRHRDTEKQSSPSPSARRKSPEKSSKAENHKSSSTELSSPKRTMAENLAYDRDEQCERDSSRRIYGHTRSGVPPTTSSERYSPQLCKRRVFGSLPIKARSSSRDKNYSPYHSSMRDHESRRSRTRSKSRTPSSRINHERDSYVNILSQDRNDSSKVKNLKSPSTAAEKLSYYKDEQCERELLCERLRSRAPTTISRTGYRSPLSRKHVVCPSRRRSSSRDKISSPDRSSVRDLRESRRSMTRSRSRTPPLRKDRERHKRHSSRERHKDEKSDSNALTTPFISIPIPVSLPDGYGYTFPGWTAGLHVPWQTPHHLLPTAAHSVPMLPMMPPLRAAHHQFPGLPPALLYGLMQPGHQPHTGHR